MKRVLRSDLWRHANFVSLWASETVSQFGTQISLLALPLIAVLTLHASAFEVGVLAASLQAPSLLFGLLAGVWIDRFRRKPLLIAADIGRAALLLSIPIASLLDLLTLPLLCVVAFVLGSLTLIFDVSYLSLVPSVVGKDQLVDANSKLEASGSLAQIGGPGLGGLLVALFSAPFAVLFDAFSFLVSAFFITRVTTVESPPVRGAAAEGIVHEIGVGLRYVKNDPILRTLAGCSAAVTFFGQVFFSVYVLYLARDLDLSPAAIGAIFAIGGVGAFIGAILAGPVARRLGVGTTLICAQLGFACCNLLVPVALIVKSVALPLLIASECLSWLMFIIFLVNAMSLRQSLFPEGMEGRLNATFRFAVVGVQPLGSLLGGLLGGLIGLPQTLVVGVAGMMLGFVWLAFSPIRGIGQVNDHQTAVAVSLTTADLGGSSILPTN